MCVCAQGKTRQTESMAMDLVVEGRVVLAGDVDAREAREEARGRGAARHAARRGDARAGGGAARGELRVAPHRQQRLEAVLRLVLQQVRAAPAHRALAHPPCRRVCACVGVLVAACFQRREGDEGKEKRE